MAAASPPAALTFMVIGQPRTKGSLQPFPRHSWRMDGKCSVSLGFREDNGFRLQQWRTQVQIAAKRAIGHEPPFYGPVRVELTFRLQRPLEQPPLHKATRYVFAKERNDIDKLTRCILDDLTAAAVFEDDGQVAELLARKFYADGEPLGVDVRIEALS